LTSVNIITEMLVPDNNIFAKRIKVRLLHKEMTVAQLARHIDRPRPSVSAAIHQGRFPRIRKQITDFLYA